MIPPDNGQTDNESGTLEYQKTVLLQRCTKHNHTYMPNEGCPDCEKEMNEAAATGE